MKVRYIYSACVVVETSDIKICCDPWFTPGAFDGSWYQYPPVREPISVIGEVDYLYISHIHPDHYDAKFLKKYTEVYPSVKIIVGETSPPYLFQKMKADGFKPEVVNSMIVGSTEVTILQNRSYEVDNIDTALVVVQNDLSVVNMNDNPFDPQQVSEVLAKCPHGRPNVALIPHSGAGPYPQTYFFESDELRLRAEDKKKRQFLELYSQYLNALKPLKAIPFAGQYFLGGPLSALNDRRGVCDAVEVAERFPDLSVVLADGGDAFIDVQTLESSAVRTSVYDPDEIRTHFNKMSFGGYDYECELRPYVEHTLPIFPLLKSAYSRAIASTSVREDFWFAIKLVNQANKYYIFNTAKDSGVSVTSDLASFSPRCEIEIDERYLFGLLTRLYHWNNASIGSHYTSKRFPDVFVREAYSFLNRFHV
ncbi:MBL fold metallo-hydrolase [Bdellovibrio sp. HCB2-146]|uniref:MBL fold metallo-hydrolase n=1 Tax=Bdellovibrio sp. HCB2-146 TaxID=3394362 RepID=UPI0039BCE689